MSDTSILPGGVVSSNPNQPGVHSATPTDIDPVTGDSVSIDPGAPITPTTSPPDEIFLAKANGSATANVLGLAITAGENNGPGQTARIKYFSGPGPLTLTTEQWDARTGGSGGLTPGDTYYLSSATSGGLTTTPPSHPDYETIIGFAISSTTMMVNITILGQVSG